MAFSPDGKWLVTGGSKGMARLWEATTGKEVARMMHKEGAVEALVFSPNSKGLATGSSSIKHFHPFSGYIVDVPGKARIWEASTGREVVRMVHEGGVRAIGFSPDAKWLATGSRDHTARMWLWRPGGSDRRSLRPSDSQPYSGGVESVPG